MTRQTDTRYIHKRLQTFADVRHALDDLCHRLSNDINDAAKVAEIEIVLAEILNNIVEHGGTSANRHPVEITWDIGTEIAFMIRDTGRPYPQLRLPVPDLPNCDDLPEGGGWMGHDPDDLSRCVISAGQWREPLAIFIRNRNAKTIN